MENETLLKEVTAKAQTWLGDGYDEATKAEVTISTEETSD